MGAPTGGWNKKAFSIKYGYSPRRVMMVPAPDGNINPLVLAAAALAGLDEIYRIGGAQAIGALAHGTGNSGGPPGPSARPMDTNNPPGFTTRKASA